MIIFFHVSPSNSTKHFKTRSFSLTYINIYILVYLLHILLLLFLKQFFFPFSFFFFHFFYLEMDSFSKIFTGQQRLSFGVGWFVGLFVQRRRFYVDRSVPWLQRAGHAFRFFQWQSMASCQFRRIRIKFFRRHYGKATKKYYW